MKFYSIIILCVCLLFSGCGIAQKSWGAANSVDAFKIITTDPSTGTIAPTILAGGGVSAMLFSLPYNNNETTSSMFAYSRRKSMWGIFSSDVNAGNVSIVYISGSKETPDDTIRILEKLEKIVNSKE